MATVPISQLSSATTLVGSDLIVVVAGGVTYKMRYDSLLSLLDSQPHSAKLDLIDASAAASGMGLALLALASPTTASFLKGIGPLAVWRTPAQTLTDIQGQPRSGALDLFASLSPTGYGGSFITMPNPLAVRYLKLIGDVDNTITQQTAAQLAADLRSFIIPLQTAKTASVGSAGTLTPDLATGELSEIYAQTGGAFTVAAPSGSPYEGQRLLIRLKDDGTGRAITWNAIYKGGTPALPATTVASKTHLIEFVYNLTAVKWQALSVSQIDP